MVAEIFDQLEEYSVGNAPIPDAAVSHIYKMEMSSAAKNSGDAITIAYGRTYNRLHLAGGNAIPVGHIHHLAIATIHSFKALDLDIFSTVSKTLLPQQPLGKNGHQHLLDVKKTIMANLCSVALDGYGRIHAEAIHQQESLLPPSN